MDNSKLNVVPLELRPVDTEESLRFDEFLETGCGCKFGPNKDQCSSSFAKDFIRCPMDEVQVERH